MPTSQDQKIIAIFMEEAGERLEELSTGLKDLPKIMASSDREPMITMYRAAHSIKGASAMLTQQMPSLASINKVSKRLEDCFKSVKDTPIKADNKVVTLSNKCYEVLKNLIQRAQSPSGLSVEMGEKIATAALPVYDMLEKHMADLMSGKAAPAVAAASSGGSKPVPSAVAKVTAVLKPMLQGLSKPESPALRKQIAGLCGHLQKIAPGVKPWQNLVKTTHGAIANPRAPFPLLKNTVIKELQQAAKLLEAGKADAIAPSDALVKLGSSQGAAPATAKEITIPADPKEVVKVLLKTFNKKELQAIAQLLIKHIKS
ncbi:MAG: Hpt domain-containing protein [Arthrospira sp. SH-MAG29]|nr:Hpt domain-containing protein [Arthrospira sp. SH-MAG29]MBS0017880.1 Hpt domain-containing protein [Arthrospira sp. SH-MAG29]